MPSLAKSPWLAWALAAAACTHGATPEAVTAEREGVACSEQAVGHYALAARLDPVARTLDAVARVRTSCAEPRRLAFFLNGELELRGASLGGEPCSLARGPDERLPYVDAAVLWLADCPARGSVPETIAIEYGGRLARTYADVNQLSPELVELAIYAAWYPIPRNARPFTSELRVELPAKLRVVSRGHAVEVSEADGRRVQTWSSRVPATDLVVIAAPTLTSVPAEPQGRGVQLFFSRRSRRDVEQLAELAERVRQLFETSFGAAPAGETLRVVYSPRAGWSYSRAGLIVASEERVMSRPAAGEPLRGEIHPLAHEIAHFWWSLADTSTADDWLNEALAEYSALRASEELYGIAEGERRERQYLEHLKQDPPPASILETRADSPHRYASWYERGALFFRAVERRLGRGRLDAFLASLRGRCAGSPLTTARFESWLAAELGVGGEELLEEWLRGREPPP